VEFYISYPVHHHGPKPTEQNLTKILLKYEKADRYKMST